MLYFDVFGRRLGVEWDGDQWNASEVGPEGKRRPAPVSIPPWIDEDGLLRFLADLFHESATQGRPDVVFLGSSEDPGTSSGRCP